MFFSVLSFVAGIVLVQQLAQLPEAELQVVIFLSSLGMAFFRQWRLMFFTMGVLWACVFASWRLDQRLPESKHGQVMTVQGQVSGLPRYDARRVRFDFLLNKSMANMPEKIRLSWYFPRQQIKAGQNWQLSVKLKPPHGRLNPGGFDYKRWLLMANIGATGYVKTYPEPVLLAESSVLNISSLRQHIAKKFDQILPGSDYKSLVKALALGIRSDISDEQWQVFRKTGTVHLLAISGLHIGLISGLVFFLIIKLAVHNPFFSPQKLAAIGTIIIALFYAALAGFSVPTQRALVMLIVAMSAIILQRNVSVINTLSLALLIIVVLDPLAVLSAGLWLSFMAVCLIVYSLSCRLGRLNHYLSACKIHIVTALGLSPLIMFYFQQFSIIAPLANFIAVPIVSLFLVPLCFMAVILLLVSIELAVPVVLLINEILQQLYFVLTAMADYSFSAMSTHQPSFYAIILAIVAVLLFISPKGVPARHLSVFLILPLLFSPRLKPDLGEVHFTLLDVGQGLAAVIETNKHVLLFDTGAKYSEQSNMGSSVVIPFLQYKGIEYIDSLLISHGDNDHIGGAKAILQHYKVGSVLSSVPESLAAYQAIQCVAGQSWQWDQVGFKVLSPAKNAQMSENNQSCVLKISTKHQSLLLTGDIEQQAEEWLLKHAKPELHSNLLIAPHHGSRTSSSFAFLNQVSPQLVLIPAGYKNRFDFPHQAVLDRYLLLNIPWLNTAEHGAITVETQNNHLQVKKTSTERRRYWHVVK